MALVEIGLAIIRPLGMEIRNLGANWHLYQQGIEQWMQSAQAKYEDLPPDVRAWLEHQGVGNLGSR
ncbi:MAG TPA: hypothetical protein VFU47_07265, partial [Armatimonadota bacterium]|nr:hypothetical protein [Armatimonadota bacterium]